MQDAENKSDNGRIYEVGYLLLPSIAQEDIPVHYGNLKELVLSLGGEVIFDEMPKMLPLAYTMSKVHQNVKSKFDTAYFGWIKFAIDPEKILELKKKLELDPNFIRFLILKTVRENTIAGRRFVNRDLKRKTTVKKEGENEAPLDREEIDKEIEAMVAA